MLRPMNTTKEQPGRHHRLRDAYRRQLGVLGPFIEGSLCKVRRPGRKTPAWQLTFAQKGKTKTVYVPAELVEDVQAWAKEFKKLKELIRKVSRQSLAIIARHGAVRRAENRARLRNAKATEPSSVRSSRTASRG